MNKMILKNPNSLFILLGNSRHYLIIHLDRKIPTLQISIKNIGKISYSLLTLIHGNFHVVSRASSHSLISFINERLKMKRSIVDSFKNKSLLLNKETHSTVDHILTAHILI